MKETTPAKVAVAKTETEKVTKVETKKEEPSCNGHGLAVKGTCYCDKHHSGEQCEFDLGHPGVKKKTSRMFYFLALCLGIVTGTFVAKVYNANGK